MSAERYGTGTVLQRGPIWYIRYYQNGKVHQESTKSTKKGAATTLLKKRLGAVAEGRPTGAEANRLTMADLRKALQEHYTAKELRSWSRAAKAFDNVTAVIGEKAKVSRITATWLETYLADRLTAGVARSTVQKELAAVKKALNLGVRRGWLPFRVPFPEMGEIQNARQEFISLVDWALARPELPEWWQDLGDMAMEMGWRCKSEFLGLYPKPLKPDPLTWAMVDWDRGLVTKGRTKNGDPRVFPSAAAPAVKAALERRLAYTQDVEQRTGKTVPYVFHEEGVPINDHQFYKHWKAACRKAGVLGADGRPKRPHDFRRSAVKAFEDNGVSRDVAMRLIGHRTPSMYSRYNIRSTDDLRAAVAQMHAPAPKAEAPAHAEAGR